MYSVDLTGRPLGFVMLIGDSQYDLLNLVIHQTLFTCFHYCLTPISLIIVESLSIGTIQYRITPTRGRPRSPKPF